MDNKTKVRFWNLVDVVSPDKCWLWTAGTNDYGYGQFKLNGRYAISSRIAYQVAVGPIPEGLKVLHTCDTPACCNPRHLFLGTNADNVADCIAKGRKAPVKFGSAHGSSKLTQEQVQDIKLAVLSGESQKSVGDRFGVSQSNVSLISRGLSRVRG